jgi:hypothetical protein
LTCRSTNAPEILLVIESRRSRGHFGQDWEEGMKAGYFEMLPQLIRRVETGDIPEGQRGYYNMNDSMKA